jgi:hypothetical protein
MSRAFLYHRTIIGYHGCDVSVLENVLLKDAPMRGSDNAYDWLGKGIYFWENGPERALEFVQAKKKREGSKSSIKTPAVLGAYIHLGRCLDLTDRWAIQLISEQYKLTRNHFNKAKLPFPENKKGYSGDHDLVLRYRDRLVIEETITNYEANSSEGKIQTVRGVFIEGDRAYPGAGFHQKTHVQIAVRDRSCILGFFKPRVDTGITV